MPKNSHTLERVAKAMGKRFDDEVMHTAMLLSYAQAVYGIIRKIAAPSPLFRLIYDERNNSVSLEETEGSSYVPKQEIIDINDLDMILIGNLRDIPVLFEGETGVGKTFISQAFMRTVFPKESYISLRLSGSTFLNNVFQPFLEGKIEQGMPVTRIKQSAIDSIAAMLVDEINRGDPQNILQLLDNELYNAGVFVKLGLRIPKLDDKGALTITDKRKKLVIVSAQNPAVTAEAKFTGTIELDAAVDNRLLKIYSGNAANSVGSAVWLTEGVHNSFDTFLESFSYLSANYLGLNKKEFENIKNDWLAMYTWITNSSRTDKPILYSALELTDIMVTILSGDLLNKHKYEKKIIRDWNSRLNLSNLNISLKEDDIKETEKVKKIHEITATFKVPIIFRDVVQIKKLADVLSTLKNIRDALNEQNSVKAYIDMDKFVSVQEIASAAALLVKSKQLPKSIPATPLVNEILLQYTSLTEKYLEDIGYMPAKFNRKDPNVGIKRVALIKAIKESMKGELTTYSKPTGHLIYKLAEEMNTIIRYSSATDEIRSILISKIVADLLTLAGFLSQNEVDIDQIMKKYWKTNKVEDIIKEIAALYYKKKETYAVIMPDIFQHRIPRTLGA